MKDNVTDIAFTQESIDASDIDTDTDVECWIDSSTLLERTRNRIEFTT